MKDFDTIRTKIKNQIVNEISIIQEVCSITFVGSFVNSQNISSISDIDIIVIVDKLNKQVFDNIENNASKIEPTNCGLIDYKIKLNMSFGPLKFNDPKTIVFHLMVYDREGHRQHVISSPFTCFDWEYNNPEFGVSLKDIYSAAPLQLNDLIGSRRSLNSYIQDIKSSSITYRYYSFSENNVTEIKKTHPIDDRHRKEFAYHIVKFLLLNFLKIIHQENFKLNDLEIGNIFLELNSDLKFQNHIIFFKKLSSWKNEGKNEPEKIIENVKLFIKDFSSFIEIEKKKSSRILFLRHQKTKLNDGTFLGIKRNPSIMEIDNFDLSNNNFDIIYTSELKRSFETSLVLNSKKRIVNQLLNEINYGEAEGLKFDELKNKFPEISKGWENHKDPSFPDGENQRDVLSRVNKFIYTELINYDNKNIAIISHLVFLRVLLGKYYKSDIYKWHLVSINHLESLEFNLIMGKLIPNLDSTKRIKFRDKLYTWIN